jgi:hypothetical protein
MIEGIKYFTAGRAVGWLSYLHSLGKSVLLGG